NGTVAFFANGVPLAGTVTLTTSGADLVATLVVPTALVQSISGGQSVQLTPGITSVTAAYSPQNPNTDTSIASSGVKTQSVQAQAFVSGHLLVYRVGEGVTVANQTTGNAVYVDEYSAAAGQTGPVQTIAFPTVTTGSTHA